MGAQELKTIGRYQLERKLGDGGVGDVFLATAAGVEGFRKPCVVKFLQTRFANDPQVIAMFLDEARLVAALQHPNIAQVYELGRVGEHFFIAMEYVVGQPLSMVVRLARQTKHPIPADVALRLCAGIAEGLSFAHSYRDEQGSVKGIVHGDVSPHNVMVSQNGLPKLIDFGVARAMGDHTGAGDAIAMGKIPYLAPELFEGKPISDRTDVYAAGVVLYEILAGRRPYRAKSTEDLIRDIRAASPVPIAVARTDLPVSVGEIVAKAIAPDPALRFASAAELAQACEEVLFANRWLVTPQKVATFIQDLFGPAWKIPERTERALDLREIVQIEEWRRELGIDDTTPGARRAVVPGSEDGETLVEPNPAVPARMRGRKGEVTAVEEVDSTQMPRVVKAGAQLPTDGPTLQEVKLPAGGEDEHTEEMSKEQIRAVAEQFTLSTSVAVPPEIVRRAAAAQRASRSSRPPWVAPVLVASAVIAIAAAGFALWRSRTPPAPVLPPVVLPLRVAPGGAADSPSALSPTGAPSGATSRLPSVGVADPAAAGASSTWSALSPAASVLPGEGVQAGGPATSGSSAPVASDRAARPAARPAERPVRVVAEPYCSLSIDGRLIGFTPVTVSLSVGSHALECRNDELGRSVSQRVDVAGGSTVQIVRLRPS